MSGDCPTCRLMDDGLPCEYHRGLADGAAERDALAAKVAALTSALERTEANFVAAVNGRPVRDMTENLAENRAALRDHP